MLEYALKAALVLLENNDHIDMENEAHKYCVSTVTIAVAGFGAKICINSWNEHYIYGTHF